MIAGDSFVSAPPPEAPPEAQMKQRYFPRQLALINPTFLSRNGPTFPSQTFVFHFHFHALKIEKATRVRNGDPLATAAPK